MPARTTRSLRRRVGLILQRIEELELEVSHLRARLADQEARAETGPRARPLPPPVPERRSRFGRPQMEPDEGARMVAWHMLRTGTPAQNVAAHLEETFDLSDAESVVEEIAHYDSRPSKAKQEG